MPKKIDWIFEPSFTGSIAVGGFPSAPVLVRAEGDRPWFSFEKVSKDTFSVSRCNHQSVVPNGQDGLRVTHLNSNVNRRSVRASLLILASRVFGFVVSPAVNCLLAPSSAIRPFRMDRQWASHDMALSDASLRLLVLVYLHIRDDFAAEMPGPFHFKEAHGILGAPEPTRLSPISLAPG
jgi:hypothetical protein